MDAGVPTALDLTKKVYENLARRLPHEARLFSYVVAKLITRRARNGGSAFDKVNIEEVYDALKRYVDRENDPLNEFVYSWDDALPKTKFDRRAFERAFQKAISASESRRLDISAARRGRSGFGSGFAISDLSKVFENAFSEASSKPFLENYINALVDCLEPEQNAHAYMSDLVGLSRSQQVCVGTLNYDRIFENACDGAGIEHDYGLSSWNEKRIIRFEPSSLRLFKLHGSINWFEQGDKVTVSDESTPYKRGLIFGGQSQKLVHYGPYLQLRHEFHKYVLRAKKIGIVGYSFQDLHINTILRDWLATKKTAKLVVLDPSNFNGFPDLGRWYDMDKDGPTKFRIEPIQIRSGARDGMDRFLKEMRAEPNLEAAAEQGPSFRIIEP